MNRLGPDKRIPEAVWTWPADLQRAFLDGYCDADGNRPADQAKHGQRTYHSASRELVEDARALHICLGDAVSNITTTKRTKPIMIKGKLVKNARDQHAFTVWSGTRQGTHAYQKNAGIRAWIAANPGFIVTPLLAITPDGEQDTWDLEIEGSHSFIADGLVVHNSGFVSYVYDHFKLFSGRTDAAGLQRWAKASSPTPGGMAFYGTPAHHVGFVVDGHTLLSALNTRSGTTLSSLNLGDNSGYGVPPSGFGKAGGAPGGGLPKGKLQELAFSLLNQYGWGNQWAAFNALETREAGWNMNAVNPGSGAAGLAQFINGWSEYFQYGGNPSTALGQLTAMMNYIANRYPPGPNAAWAHEVADGWYSRGGPVGIYDQGGILPPGGVAVNMTSRPEQVLSPSVTAMAAGGAVGAYRSRLSGEEAEIRKFYGEVAGAIHHKGLAKSTRDELGTLARRETAEVAAFSAAMRNLTSTAVSHLGAEARSELRTAHDKGLAHLPGIGSLIYRLGLLNVTAQHPPKLSGGGGGGGTSGGGSGSGVLPKPPPLPAHLTGAQWLARFRKAQAAEYHDYLGLKSALEHDLAHARKGSWTYGHRAGIRSELGTLAKRQSAEEAAYDNILHHGTGKANLAKMATRVREVTTTSRDKDLAHSHPGWTHGLQYELAILGQMAASRAPSIAPPKLQFSDWLGKLKADQSRETADYRGLEAAFKSSLAHARKGTWDYKNRKALGERLYAVAIRQNAETAAYSDLVKHSSGSVADLTGLAGRIGKLGSQARAEAGSLQPSLLGHLPGGHPGWVKALQAALNQIASLTASQPFNPPWNPGNLGPSHTAPGGVLRFDTGRGVLAPGMNLAWNGTGRDEALSRAGAGSGPQTIKLEFAGGGSDLEQLLFQIIRKTVRVRGGGNVQTAYGRG
jgi:hypothetical protein